MHAEDCIDTVWETVAEFCAAEGWNYATYKRMRAMGFGPQEVRLPGGRKISIPRTEHRVVRAKLLAWQQTEAAELERARASEIGKLANRARNGR